MKGSFILFIFFYWGIAYSVGLVALVIYLSLYLKHGNKDDLFLFLFDINILLIVVSISLLNFLPETYGSEAQFLGVTSFFFSALLIFTLPLFVHNRLTKSKKIILNSLFFGLSMAGLALLILTIVMDNLFFGNIILILMGLTIVYSMVILILRGINKGRKGIIDSSSLISGALTIILMPIILCVDFGVFVGDVYSGSIRNILFFPGFYLVLNLIFIISSRKLFISKQLPLGSFVEYYSISKREIDVLKLLVGGKSYQEISDTLNISLSTVKTHISRLYQKTKTKNRVELAALLGKSTESTT